MAKLTRIQQQIESQRRKDAKQAAHAAMMAERAAMLAKQAEERAKLTAAITAWEVAYEGWRGSGEVGPRPIHPLDVGTGTDWNAYEYDMSNLNRRFNEVDDSDDLISAAQELGIDIGVI